MTDYRALVFSYDFPHNKTRDLLLQLRLAGVNVVAVLGAPSVMLDKKSTWTGFKRLPLLTPEHPRLICERLGFRYEVSPHSNISGIVESVGANIGLIAGARIISGDTIRLFQHGVINYHPGRIPETSGLDSFYWMLEKNVPPVITAHFIDHRVDAGEAILYQPIEITDEETPATINYKLYIGQLQVHQKICEQLASGQAFVTEALTRPEKNEPMNDRQRQSAMAKFKIWKLHQLKQL